MDFVGMGLRIIDGGGIEISAYSVGEGNPNFGKLQQNFCRIWKSSQKKLVSKNKN